MNDIKISLIVLLLIDSAVKNLFLGNSLMKKLFELVESFIYKILISFLINNNHLNHDRNHKGFSIFVHHNILVLHGSDQTHLLLHIIVVQTCRD